MGERGAALVTAATTTSAMSSQSTSTGGSLEAVPLVKGISANQSSPALGIVVKPLVFRGVAVQKGAVVATDKRHRFGLLSRHSTTPGHPGRELLEILRRELLDDALDLFYFAHCANLVRRAAGGQEAKRRKADAQGTASPHGDLPGRVGSVTLRQ